MEANATAVGGLCLAWAWAHGGERYRGGGLGLGLGLGAWRRTLTRWGRALRSALPFGGVGHFGRRFRSAAWVATLGKCARGGSASLVVSVGRPPCVLVRFALCARGGGLPPRLLVRLPLRAPRRPSPPLYSASLAALPPPLYSASLAALPPPLYSASLAALPPPPLLHPWEMPLPAALRKPNPAEACRSPPNAAERRPPAEARRTLPPSPRRFPPF